MVNVADIGHQVGNVSAAVTHLFDDVVLPEDCIDLSQHTRTVVVDENNTDMVFLRGGKQTKTDFRHVDSTDRGSFVDVTHESISHFDTNSTLSLCRSSLAFVVTGLVELLTFSTTADVRS
jgi:hypothetical protein